MSLRNGIPVSSEADFSTGYIELATPTLAYEETINNMRAKSKEAAISQCDVLHITRSQVKKPNQPLFSNKMSEHYTAEDLYIGAQVEFNCFVFKIVDAGKNRGRTIGLQLQ